MSIEIVKQENDSSLNLGTLNQSTTKQNSFSISNSLSFKDQAKFRIEPVPLNTKRSRSLCDADLTFTSSSNSSELNSIEVIAFKHDESNDRIR